VTNVTFHEGTLDGPVPFEPGQFDSAWAFSILHLVPDRRDELERIFSLLKPGGSFVSSNVCLKGTWVPYGALIAVMRWFGKAPMVHLYDRETILSDLREVGFVDVTVHDVGADSKVLFLTATKP
jgi:SAM-dependent methyltransferase